MKTKLTLLAPFLIVTVAVLALVLGLQPARADLPFEGREKFGWANAADITASGGAALTSAVSGKKQRIVGLHLTATDAGVVSFFDGSGGDTIGAFYLAANTPTLIPSDILGEGMLTTAGNAIYADAAAGTLTGFVRYRLE